MRLSFLALAVGSVSFSAAQTTTTSTSTSATTTFPLVATSVVSRPTQMALSSTFQISSVPQTRDYDFVIDARMGAPDGFDRRMFVVNGQVEGPLIEANQGDTLRINVTNNLDIGVTLHWHGMAQNGSTWADGPSGVTQCPIPPGQSFLYEFTLSREDQYGTYWWHAHRGALYADGLTGPLIIHSPNDPLVRGVDYDLDQIIFVRDHFHDMSTDIVTGLLSAAGYNGNLAAPSPSSGLINGHGVYDCSFASSDEACVANQPLELVFPPDTKVRLRFINGGTHASFKVSADNHTLEVIEADDTPVNGPSVHRIPIQPAQRYSAILDTTGDSDGSSFFLRAQMNTDCFGAPFTDLDPDVKAIIRIASSNATISTDTPTSVDWDDALGGVCVDLDEYLLVPRVAIDAPTLPDTTGIWNVQFNFTSDGFLWTINAVTCENFLYNPLYFQVYGGGSLDSTDVTFFEVDSVQTVDIVINNVLGAEHPFHLHGSKCWVVARGDGTLTEADLSYNTTNPIRRDVLSVPANQYAIVRIISDIPGVHIFHCHIAWHQAAGLSGALVVQPSSIRNNTIPDSAFALCNAANFEPGKTVSSIDAGKKRRGVAEPAIDRTWKSRRHAASISNPQGREGMASDLFKTGITRHRSFKH
ncbi:hypothetical protein T439DRAFT_376655 [Meredithblackwellia eburnea MCA 4105]